MPEEKRTDDVEKFLAEQKAFEDRKQGLIDDLLKQRDAAMAAFDEKLAKLGYHANSGKRGRSHHKKAAASTAAETAAAKPAAKPKA
jgi:hypothetical protein